MVSERIYDLCRPILDNNEFAEEEKVEKLEELLSQEPQSLKGKALEDAVLGTLWQWKTNTDNSTSPPPARATTNVVRSRSPAPWIQRAATPSTPSGTSSPRPSAATPAVPPGFGPPALARTKSQTVGSPFSSPKPSPRLPLATPVIPHSPRLSAYQFSDSSPNTENYGDYGSDNVDWLVNDDASSQTSFGDFGSSAEFMSPYTAEMSPYDMLRSILQDSRTDEELEQILEANGYDLSQTINSLMDAQGMGPNAMAAAIQQQEQQHRTYLIGKNMSPASRPSTPAGQQKSPTVCRYWLASGHCARADCRFAHEVQNHLCKYWLAGNCIAGNSCLFSHDPSLLMQQLSMASSSPGTPQQLPPNFALQDFDSFPALQPTTSNPYEEGPTADHRNPNSSMQQQTLTQPPGLFPNFVPTGPRNPSRPSSRPGSRHNSRAATPSHQPNFQDDEAFPSLGSAASKPVGKRHHGKRGGHGHHNHGPPVQQPGSLADVVRMSPSPGPNNARDAMRRGLKNNRSFTATRENSAAAMAIPAPKEIPWLETGEKVNQAYMKARQEAFKHGGLRNKFLQSAAQAWNRNDARGAKALSLRGQNENQLMREKHREAASALYEERNKNLAAGGNKELYVDLHGLHPEEAVQYLSDCLKEQKNSSRPVYAICGTGHHSKNGKDKVGKAIRLFLNEWRYAFREFSVPGDRNNVGGILGIDPTSYDKDAGKKTSASLAVGDSDSGIGLNEARKEDTKVTLVREDPRKAGPTTAGSADEEDDDS
jgi:DNA-nicking Smr family endonuclease